MELITINIDSMMEFVAKKSGVSMDVDQIKEKVYQTWRSSSAEQEEHSDCPEPGEVEVVEKNAEDPLK